MKAGMLIKSTLFLFCFLLFGCKPDAIDSNGRPINLSDYHGKWVVIHYWATWCSPCIQEIPELIKLKNYYATKVEVLGVNTDNLDNSVLRKLSEAYGVNYPFLNNFPIEKWAEKPTKLPVTFIFNPNGKLYQTLYGPQNLANFQAVMSLPPVVYQ